MPEVRHSTSIVPRLSGGSLCLFLKCEPPVKIPLRPQKDTALFSYFCSHLSHAQQTKITASPSRRDSKHCDLQSSASHVPSLEGCLLQAAKGAYFIAAMLKKMPKEMRLTV